MSKPSKELGTNVTTKPAKPKNIVIRVNRASAIILPKSNAHTGVGYSGGMKLLPGENNMDKSYWDVIKKNGTVKKWLAVGWIENLGSGKAKDITDSLEAVPMEKTGRYIDAETSVPTLMKLRDADKRAPVKKAINVRIKKITDEQDGEAAE